jgi:cyclase
MLTKRIIPCLDVMNGRTVKGVNFENLRDAGDAVELGALYAAQGADELVFLDITATHEKRKTLTELVRNVSAAINIPFTVGGGISSIEDVRTVLMNGADKVSINSAAVRNPQLINELSREFGNQCIVLAVDVKFEAGEWSVFLNGGKIPSGFNAQEWIREAVDRGAGEILLTSMNNDGMKNGFAVELTKEISEMVSVPVIASGGAGSMEDFLDVFANGKADAALAASIFHFREIEIAPLKNYLMANGIAVRSNSI